MLSVLIYAASKASLRNHKNDTVLNGANNNYTFLSHDGKLIFCDS